MTQTPVVLPLVDGAPTEPGRYERIGPGFSVGRIDVVTADDIESEYLRRCVAVGFQYYGPYVLEEKS